MAKDGNKLGQGRAAQLCGYSESAANRLKRWTAFTHTRLAGAAVAYRTAGQVLYVSGRPKARAPASVATPPYRVGRGAAQRDSLHHRRGPVGALGRPEPRRAGAVWAVVSWSWAGRWNGPNYQRHLHTLTWAGRANRG